MAFLYVFTTILLMFLCVILCSVILMQESKSTGLGTSFGGDTGSSLFGTATADVLRKFTAWTACFFLLMCIFLSVWTTSLGRSRVPVSPQAVEQIEQ